VADVVPRVLARAVLAQGRRRLSRWPPYVLSALQAQEVSVIRDILRWAFSRAFCDEGAHRWVLLGRHQLYVCKDCLHAITVQEYRSK
jgi:hypothetical protein